MEKSQQTYLDSSVFIPANLKPDQTGERAREIINSVKEGAMQGYTSTLTFDEVVFTLRKFGGFEKSVITGDIFLNIPHLKFIEVTYEIITLAQDLIKKYRLKPRDAIHAACAINKGIKIIISDDADFDAIKELERKSIKDFKIPKTKV